MVELGALCGFVLNVNLCDGSKFRGLGMNIRGPFCHVQGMGREPDGGARDGFRYTSNMLPWHRKCRYSGH